VPGAHTCNPGYSKGRQSGGLWFEVTSSKKFTRPHLEKSLHKNGLAEWLKVWALSSNPSTKKKKRKKKITSMFHVMQVNGQNEVWNFLFQPRASQASPQVCCS
jgi:hypothetical protein